MGQMENAGNKLYCKSKNVGFERFQEQADVRYDEELAGLVWTGLTFPCRDFSRERLAPS